METESNKKALKLEVAKKREKNPKKEAKSPPKETPKTRKNQYEFRSCF